MKQIGNNLQTVRRVATLFSFVFVALTSVAASAAPTDRVRVQWAATEQLSEVRDNQMQRGWMRPNEWEKQLGEHLRKRAESTLPAGEQLEVTIDDIKLAGSFEPWHGPAAEDIRFMRDIYPPRIDLHYRLLGSDGSVLREGNSKLRDLSYLMRIVPNETDPLRYDKRLLDDWLRKEFRDGGAAAAALQRGA